MTKKTVKETEPEKEKEQLPTIRRIETCAFRRTKKGKLEAGLLLNGGKLGILAKNGEVLENGLDIKKNYFFALNVGLVLRQVEKKLSE